MQAAVSGAMPAGGEAAAPSWRGRDVLLISLISMALFLIGIVGYVVGMLLGDSELASAPERLAEGPQFGVGALAFSALALGGAVWMGVLWRRRGWADLGLGRVSWRALGLAALAALGMRIAMVPLVLALQALGMPADNPQLALLQTGDLATALALLALVGLAVPLAEELFFRGVLYRWLRQRWGVTVGALASAAVFGAMHGHPTIGVAMGLLGLALALVYERTRSLSLCVAIHAIFNTLGLALILAMQAAGVQLPGA